MPYDKPKILIDLEEYNELKGRVNYANPVQLDQYSLVVCALVNSGADIKLANSMLIQMNLEIQIGKSVLVNNSTMGTMKNIIPQSEIKIINTK